MNASNGCHAQVLIEFKGFFYYEDKDEAMDDYEKVCTRVCVWEGEVRFRVKAQV